MIIKTLLINLPGLGRFDSALCDRQFSWELENFDYPTEMITGFLTHLLKVVYTKFRPRTGAGFRMPGYSIPKH
ncbi:MAG: hypothetical protein KZQ93_10370 [Candidatus Thiodiazotropha sp. (ex Monitilora ramsayi)]|nr:hypothetical protein [Candidatus Thiodiazotropha sp. (ex Monitilora ramsayi)]